VISNLVNRGTVLLELSARRHGNGCD